MSVTSPPPVRRITEKVALSPEGRVLTGSSSSGLPEAASYAAQMADLVGDFLGLEGFRSLEASFEKQHVLVARTADGGLVAQRASEAESLEPLRKELLS